MKSSLFCTALVFAFLTLSRAVDVVTPDGTLKDVKVTKVEAEGVRVTHTEGTAYVDFDLLPPEMQAEYGWTPEKSAARKAAKEAEAKRIADEEKMAEEAPKRKAMEEEAKKKAEEEKAAAEEKAKMRAANAEFESKIAETEKEQLAASAAARAALDRERKGIKASEPAAPAAAPAGNGATQPAEPQSPAPTVKIVTPGVGTVADAIVTENPLLQNYKLWIGVIAGLIVVTLLFMLPSGGTVKKVRRH